MEIFFFVPSKTMEMVPSKTMEMPPQFLWKFPSIPMEIYS